MSFKKLTKSECDRLNAEFAKYHMEDIGKRVSDLEACSMLNIEQHKTILEKIETGFSHMEKTLTDFSIENKEHHEQIIGQQKHTNGDVSALKIWRAGLAGGMAVILACGGFLTTYFFLEKQEQKKQSEQVIVLTQQISQITNKLNDWEYAEK
jgi:hypothetical protein